MYDVKNIKNLNPLLRFNTQEPSSHSEVIFIKIKEMFVWYVIIPYKYLNILHMVSQAD